MKTDQRTLKKEISEWAREKWGENLNTENVPLVSAVVYQKPKLSAEKESFQLSAFGFGRRN